MHDRLSTEELDELVTAARAGDEDAWARLVRSLSRPVHRSLNSFGLPADVREELFHMTFVRLFERLGTIRSPAALPSWLMTTAQNEARQWLKRASRTVPVAEVVAEVDRREPVESLLTHEMSQAVRVAFDRLPARCQQLLRLLTLEPKVSYLVIAESMGLTHGDIGPTRQRCLEKLRRDPALVAFLDRPAGGRAS